MCGCVCGARVCVCAGVLAACLPLGVVCLLRVWLCVWRARVCACRWVCVCPLVCLLPPCRARVCALVCLLFACPKQCLTPTVNEQEDSRFGTRNWAPLNVRSADGRGLGVAAAAVLSGGSFSFRIARIIESSVSNDLNKSNS